MVSSNRELLKAVGEPNFLGRLRRKKGKKQDNSTVSFLSIHASLIAECEDEEG